MMPHLYSQEMSRILAIEELGTARAGGIRNLDELELRDSTVELVEEEGRVRSGCHSTGQPIR